MKKTLINLCIALPIFLITTPISCCYAQSAIGQLESISGQKIQTSSVGVPSPSMMIGEAVMGGIINSIFSNNSQQQQQQQQAAQQAALIEQQKIAAQKAEEQRLKDSADQAHYVKIISNSKSLPGSGKLGFKPPPLPESSGNSNENAGSKTKFYIDIARDIAIGCAGMAPPGASYGLIAGIHLCALDAKYFVDALNGKPVPPTTQIITNALINASGDLAAQALGDGVKWSLAAQYRNLEKIRLMNNGVLPGIAMISETPALVSAQWIAKYDKVMFRAGGLLDGTQMGWSILTNK